MQLIRRAFIKNLSFSAAGASLPPTILTCNTSKSSSVRVGTEPKTLQKYSPKAKQLVKEATCIDMLGTYQDWFNERGRMPCKKRWLNIPNSLTQEDFEFIKQCGFNQRMNLVGMALDDSRCGDETTLGGIEASSKPVLIPHGACRAIAKGVASAKTDEVTKAMAESGGVLGIPILRFMIREKEPVSIDDFIGTSIM